VDDSVGADKSNPWFTLVVCNYAGDGDMWFAVSIPNNSENPQKVIRGWWTIADGGCRSILQRDFGSGPYNAMELFYHAETKNWHWPNKSDTELELCMADTRYQRTQVHPYDCQGNEKQRPFGRDVVNKDGDLFEATPEHTVHTITLHR
jgi:uncharacterized membrane protein